MIFTVRIVDGERELAWFSMWAIGEDAAIEKAKGIQIAVRPGIEVELSRGYGERIEWDAVMDTAVL